MLSLFVWNAVRRGVRNVRSGARDRRASELTTAHETDRPEPRPEPTRTAPEPWLSTFQSPRGRFEETKFYRMSRM